MNELKVLVYVREENEQDREQVAGMVTAVLAPYAVYLLVQVTDAQITALQAAGFRVSVQQNATRIEMGVTFDTTDPPQPPPAAISLADEAASAATGNYFLVQFIGPIKDAWKTAVIDLGGELLGYIPNNTFIVHLPAAAQAPAAALPFVEWVGPYLPAYKISPRLTTTGRQDVSGQVLTLDINPAAAPFDEEGNLEISLHKPDDLAATVVAIEALGGQMIDQGERNLIVAIAPEQIATIAQMPAVSWITDHVPPALTNDVAGTLTNIHPLHDLFPPGGLRGRNQIVAVADTGIDDTHPDFSGRIHRRYSWGRPASGHSPGGAGRTDDPSGHGTHVCGTILGDGTASSGLVHGMAPEARLVIQSVFRDKGGSCDTPPHRRVNLTRLRLPSNLGPLLQQAYDDGARVHNNSWGSRKDGEYEAKSAKMDEFVCNHKDMVILTSAGNSGDDLDRNGVVDNDSMGAPGTAKNIITVGASESLRAGDAFTSRWGSRTYCPPSTRSSPDGDRHRFPRAPLQNDLVSDNPHGLAASSSRGLTDDHRLKPDVVAPGTNILSTRSSTSGRRAWSQNNRYHFSSGTSMACPIVAGAAVLTRQFLIEKKGHGHPSAALIKAMLIHSATPLQGQYRPREIGSVPNKDIGWGLINLREILLPPPPRQLWFHDEWQDPSQSLHTGEDARFVIRVTDPTETLKITLVWSDAPATEGAGRKLVNNLNLKVVTPAGGVIPGNQGLYASAPDGPPHACYERDGDGNLWDQCNNVESVIIELAERGEYQISVIASNVTRGPQDYALVISGAFALVPPPPAPPGGAVIV